MEPDSLDKLAYRLINFMTAEEAKKIDDAADSIIRCLDGMSHLNAVQALQAARVMVNSSVAKSKVSSKLATYQLLSS